MDKNTVEILLVEDDANEVELILHAWKKCNLSGQIQVMRDGVEALEFVFCTGKYADRSIKKLPKVIFLDLKLPKVDGLEVLRRIKSDPRTCNIPVVMFTSSDNPNDIQESYRLGVNSYVVKTVAEFSETVRQLGAYWVQLNRPPAR